MKSESAAGSLADFESAAGYEANSTTAVGSTLGFGFGTGSATEGCFWPATSQSTEGNFQHYARLLHSMYTVHGALPLIVAKYLACVTLDGFSTSSSSSSPKSSSKSFDLLILRLG